MRLVLALACLAAAACSECPPPVGPPPSAGLTATSVVAFPLTTPTVTACIDGYCDVVTTSSPTTSPVPLPHAHATLQIALSSGGTLVILEFDAGDDVDAGTVDDGGVLDAHVDGATPDAAIIDAGSRDGGTRDAGVDAGHAHDGSAVYLLVFEPSYGRNVTERAAPVPSRASCSGAWTMSL